MKQALRPSRVIRFGLFEVNLENAELRKSGMRQKLVGQSFEVLRALLEHPGQLVTREKLRQHLWPDNTVVDYDLALKRVVNRVREALGDSAESPRFVETVPRQGYRFIANIERDSPTQASIAVLPFMNMSSDAENEFFADGMTEEIINALSQIEDLHVAARTSSFFFKGKHADMREIGQQLNVQTVLEGSVRKVGAYLRITAQLVNVADGYHLWSERYDRELKDIFAIQDEIARAIAQRLKLSLDGNCVEPLVKTGTQNLEAYQLYLKGRALLYRRGLSIPRAVECFDRAVRLDPEYPLAWAGLADSYTALGYSGLAHPDSCMPHGMEAARRALSLDPSLAEAHSALAMAALMGTWDKAEAEREFRSALDLNPRYIQGRGWYAFFYLQLCAGRLVEGTAQAKLVVESDPLSSYAHTMYGFTCALADNYQEAVQAARRAMELDSESYLAHMLLQLVLHVSGKFEESVAVARSALAMSGRHAWSLATLTVTLGDWGKNEAAGAVYGEMVARARQGYISPVMLAAAAAGASREDETISHAREAFQIRAPECFFFSRFWPLTARMYAYPRFRDLLSEVGFK